MYVISGRTVDNNWVYASNFDGPGYSVRLGDAIRFETIDDAKKFYDDNKDIYQNLTDKAVRKVIFKRKVVM